MARFPAAARLAGVLVLLAALWAPGIGTAWTAEGLDVPGRALAGGKPVVNAVV